MSLLGHKKYPGQSQVGSLFTVLGRVTAYLLLVTSIEIGYREGERVIKINFGFIYRFTNS